MARTIFAPPAQSEWRLQPHPLESAKKHYPSFLGTTERGHCFLCLLVLHQNLRLRFLHPDQIR